MPAMNQGELEEFLRQPLVATFVTIRRDGTPHVSPMWYGYYQGRFYCWVNANAVKTRNVRRDPRVALCIGNHDKPYKYVVVEGACEIVEEGAAEIGRSISARYYGTEKGEEFARGIIEKGESVLLAVTARKILTENQA